MDTSNNNAVYENTGTTWPAQQVTQAPVSSSYVETTTYAQAPTTLTNTEPITYAQAPIIENAAPVYTSAAPIYTTSATPVPYTTADTTTSTTPAKQPFGKRMEQKSNVAYQKVKTMTGKWSAKLRAKKGNKAQPGEKLETYVEPAPTATPIGTAGL